MPIDNLQVLWYNQRAVAGGCGAHFVKWQIAQIFEPNFVQNYLLTFIPKWCIMITESKERG